MTLREHITEVEKKMEEAEKRREEMEKKGKKKNKKKVGSSYDDSLCSNAIEKIVEIGRKTE